MRGFDLDDISGDFFDALKPYQKKILDSLLESCDEEAAAQAWLSSSGPLELKRFGGGGEGEGKEFFELFLSEFRSFVCGGERYEKEREAVLKYGKPLAAHVVTAISVALAFTLGISEALITPAVALMLKVIGKMGVNAWCSLTG
ncbi:hypothetical protein [Pseudomonas putida]|uniref:hypothetical protein n=1 Tax=Pseudomonas putida TaxID=303 RepID=UPI00114CC9F6|nr:hypothetical protein [Pseudomonas putida]